MSAKSIVGPGTIIRGSLRGSGSIVFDGSLEGDFEVDGDVEVGATAQIKSSVVGGRIAVRGAVLGDITGQEAIILEEGAKVVGNLSAPRIGIRPGGLLRGHVATGAATGVTAHAEARRAAPAARRPEVRTKEVRAVSAVAAPPARRPAPPAPKPVEVPKGRGRSRQAPPPVMPMPQKGQKGALKKRSARG